MHAWILTAAAVLFGVLPHMAAAAPPVDCSNPDNLCTGDPCVIPSLEVASPCVVDFSPRAVVIAGTLNMPTFAVLSLTAADITVSGTVQVEHQADVLLTAENITVAGRILGSSAPDAIVTLTATDELTVAGVLRTVDPEGSGLTEFQLNAGGNLELAGLVRVRSTDPFVVGQLSADAGGILTISGRIVANGSSVTLAAAQGITVDRPIRVANLGINPGGELRLESTGGGVVINRGISVRGRGCCFIGGGILEVEALGDIVVNRSINAAGPTFGGQVSFTSTAGNVTIDGPIRVSPGAGAVTVQAGQVATLNHRVALRAASDLRVEAASVVVGPRAKIRGNDRAKASRLCFRATGGDLVLGGRFLVHGAQPQPEDGNIEASATGNLIADGVFRCAPDGCIALTAGGSLDTANGSFDKSLSLDCPLDCASPSGAFLEFHPSLLGPASQ